jgi:hypothetical protein
VPPKLLPGVDIGDVHLDDGRFHCQQSVQYRDRCRRVAGRIYDEPGRFFCPCLVDPIDDLAFMI